MGSSRRKTKSQVKPARAAFLQFIHRAGAAELLIFAATVGVGLWAWLASIVTEPQDWATFGVVFLAASVLNGLLQAVFFMVVRPPGTFRQRVSFSTASQSASGSGVVFWALPLLFALAFALTTPPSTPADGFEHGMSIYGVILLMAGLSLAAALFGGVVFAMIILPILMLIAAILPEPAPSAGRQRSGDMSRGELVTGGLLVPVVGVFGVSMYFVAPTATGGDYGTRGRMAEQFTALVSLHGNLAASALAVLCVASIVVLTVLNNRYSDRRQNTENAKRYTS